MAGTPMKSLQEVCGGAVVRAMPNTPAAIGRGITVAVAASNVSAAQRATADALLRATGSVEWVDDEGLMDAVTAVSGSGPAYIFLLAEELARAGVAAGLPEALATRLARETVAGSGELLHRSELPSSTLRQNVTSPGGTTAAALEVLMGKDGMQQLMTRAIAAATARSKESGEVGSRPRTSLVMRGLDPRIHVFTSIDKTWMRRDKPGHDDWLRAALHRRAEPLVETLDIDEAAGVKALADLAFAVEGGDLEAEDAALDRDHLRGGAHGGADRRRGEMLDVYLGADGDPARL